MTALLLDVGNSRLKWGIAEDGVISKTGHIAQETIREDGLQVLTTRLPRRVDAVLASNVAGVSYATRLTGVLGAHCNCDVRFARSERHGWGVTNSYRQPRRLGVDRFVALVAAWAEFQSSCLIVDAGTAVTIDALDDDGNHLGGQILPGAETMLASLSSTTSDLPLVKTLAKVSAADLSIFGRNTTAAIREGTQNAVNGAIERALRIMREGGHEPTVVLTGGGSSRILGALNEVPLHRPHLVMQGLAHMLDNAQ